MADAIVRIWWFSWDPLRVLGGGHGSIELPNNGPYITWLGGEARDYLIKGQWGLNTDQVRFGSIDDTIRIPVRDARDNPCGLHQPSIVEWWNNLKQQNPDRWYVMLSRENNCDGTVLLALKAGQAELYAEAPLNLFQGASSLKRWAEAVRDAIADLNTKIKRAAQVLQRVAHEIHVNWQPNMSGKITKEIWTLKEWQDQSSVFMGRRIEQVEAIDKLLTQYHALGPVPGHGAKRYAPTPGDITKFRQRISLLNNILAQCVSHLEKKPRSDRRNAVTNLGFIIYDKIQELNSSLEWSMSIVTLSM